MKELTNHEVVTIAVYLLGGEAHDVDTEDVAVKANELAPGRFAWKKYPDQINIEHVRVCLSRAKNTKNGAYLSGVGARGWRLTEAGLAFTRQRTADIKGADLSRKPLSAKDRHWQQTERIRMLSEEAFEKFQNGEVDTIMQREVEKFFRVDDYVVGAAREQKVVRFINVFGDDSELGAVVKVLADKLRSK